MQDKKAMNSTTTPISRGFAASVPGAGHIRYGTPCQDASGIVLSPRPAAIVCDGRGSAKLSHFGAQGAVRAFFSQLNVLEPFLAGVLDREAPPEKWNGLCRLLYRTLLQVKLDLAAEKGGDEKDFDFTVAFAVAGRKSIGCFQVGDGAIVLRNDGICRTAFDPDKGEFSNQTCFLRPGGEAKGRYHAGLFPAQGNAGTAITSDGPEYLMFRQADMEPGPIFGQLLDDLAAGELCEQDLRDYLTRSVWAADPRGSDDRSIAVLMPSPVAVVPQKPREEPARGKEMTPPPHKTPDAIPAVMGPKPSIPERPEPDRAPSRDKVVVTRSQSSSKPILPWVMAAMLLMALVLLAVQTHKMARETIALARHGNYGTAREYPVIQSLPEPFHPERNR